MDKPSLQERIFSHPLQQEFSKAESHTMFLSWAESKLVNTHALNAIEKLESQNIQLQLFQMRTIELLRKIRSSIGDLSLIQEIDQLLIGK